MAATLRFTGTTITVTPDDDGTFPPIYRVVGSEREFYLDRDAADTASVLTGNDVETWRIPESAGDTLN